MGEEKDIFDLFREGSEELVERPSERVWRQLDRRLDKRRRVGRRRPLGMQLTVVTAILGLLLLVGVVGWYVTREHEIRFRANLAFEGLRVLEGRWENVDRETTDKMVWQTENGKWKIENGGSERVGNGNEQWEKENVMRGDSLLNGARYVYFKDAYISTDQLIFRKTKKTLFLDVFSGADKVGEIFELKSYVSGVALFEQNKKGGLRVVVKVVDASLYSIQLGSGSAFMFSKIKS